MGSTAVIISAKWRVTLRIARHELITSVLRQPLSHPGTGSHCNCGSTRVSWWKALVVRREIASRIVTQISLLKTESGKGPEVIQNGLIPDSRIKNAFRKRSDSA
jgi:hypothetical protein